MDLFTTKISLNEDFLCLSLFKVFNRVISTEPYFRKGQRPNSAGKKRFTPLQKVVSAMSQLTYGVLADEIDKYIISGEYTSLEALKVFCKTVVKPFEH